MPRKEKKWRPAPNKDKKIRWKKATNYNDRTSLKKSWINSNES